MHRRKTQRAANVAFYAQHREDELARVKVRQARTVAFLRMLRDQPCADCGGRFLPHQMDFDHRGPRNKSFQLTAGRAMLRARENLLAEAAKCDVVCANCHRRRTQAWHAQRAAGPAGTSRYLERKRERWRRHAALLDRLRDVPCADCGGRFPPCVMDFDHRDRALKRYTVSRMIGRAGEARILDEVAKCDIVCANCHRVRTLAAR